MCRTNQQVCKKRLAYMIDRVFPLGISLLTLLKEFAGDNSRMIIFHKNQIPLVIYYSFFFRGIAAIIVSKRTSIGNVCQYPFNCGHLPSLFNTFFERKTVQVFGYFVDRDSLVKHIKDLTNDISFCFFNRIFFCFWVPTISKGDTEASILSGFCL